MRWERHVGQNTHLYREETHDVKHWPKWDTWPLHFISRETRSSLKGAVHSKMIKLSSITLRFTSNSVWPSLIKDDVLKLTDWYCMNTNTDISQNTLCVPQMKKILNHDLLYFWVNYVFKFNCYSYLRDKRNSTEIHLKPENNVNADLTSTWRSRNLTLDAILKSRRNQSNRYRLIPQIYNSQDPLMCQNIPGSVS